MEISRKSIINNKRDLVNFLIDLLFCVVIMQGMGAPGNFADVLGPAKSAWYAMNHFAPIILFVLMLFVTRCKIMRRDLYIFLFCAYILASGVVISGFSSYAIEQSYQLVLTISASLLMVRIRDKHSVVMLFAIAQILVTLMILFMIFTSQDSVAVSDSDYDFNLVGLHTTKNTCGYLMVFGSILFYYLFRTENVKRSRKLLWFVLIIVELVLAYLARTVGAYFGGLVPILIFEIVSRSEKSFSFAKFYTIVNVGFWVVICLILPSIAFIIESMGKSATLTGRTDIWSSIVSFVSGIHIFVGYGYGGFWRNAENTKGLYAIYSQRGIIGELVGGHNIFLELYVNIGLVGITLFLMMLFSMMKPSKYTPAKFLGFEALCLSYELFRGLVERTLNSVTYDTIVLMVAAGMIYRTYTSVKRLDHREV